MGDSSVLQQYVIVSSSGILLGQNYQGGEICFNHSYWFCECFIISPRGCDHSDHAIADDLEFAIDQPQKAGLTGIFMLGAL